MISSNHAGVYSYFGVYFFPQRVGLCRGSSPGTKECGGKLFWGRPHSSVSLAEMRSYPTKHSLSASDRTTMMGFRLQPLQRVSLDGA